jgi:hypothetical protein
MYLADGLESLAQEIIIFEGVVVEAIHIESVEWFYEFIDDANPVFAMRFIDTSPAK